MKIYNSLRISFPFFLCLFLGSVSRAQPPSVKWQYYQRSASSYADYLADAAPTSDGGFISTGFDTMRRINVTNYLNKIILRSPTLKKWNSEGKVVWQRYYDINYGGSYYSSIVEASDGTFLIGGIQAESGDTNFVAARFTSSGTPLWLKHFGGTLGDIAHQVIQTSGGDILLSGYSNSADGDVIKRHDGTEVWLVHADVHGNMQWAQTYGGNGQDTGYAVCETPDGGFIVCGTSNSSDGDLNGHYGNGDGWVFKVNASGALQWQKNFGGSQRDVLNKVVRNSDNTYTLSGYSSSNDGDITGHHGDSDLWVIRIDETGNLLWSRVFGGSADDAGYGLTSSGEGALVCGYTRSDDGDVSKRAGGADSWILNVSSTGDLIWQKCVGTMRDEFAITIMLSTAQDIAFGGIGGIKTPAPFTHCGVFTGLGSGNTIHGKMFYDANENGVQDAGEPGFDNSIISVQKTNYVRSTVPYDGDFDLYVDTGHYTVSAQIKSPYFDVVPESYTRSFASYHNNDTVIFAVQPNATANDLQVTIPYFSPVRPGFPVQYQVSYKNVGVIDAGPGRVKMKKDPRLTYESSTAVPQSVTDTMVTWNYDGLQVLEAHSFYVNFTAAPPPATNINDTIHTVVIVEPEATDGNPINNTAELKQVVTGSYDPNDKAEANAGIITPEQISGGENLHYLIRFQNTGTDTAFTVIVRDTLDTRLDESGFEMTGASHPYTLSIADGNKLAWTFYNILLPDSNVNEPASHGYIAYRIRPRPSVKVGDTIKNNASIYFDFNPPIVTNLANTIVLDLFPLPVHLEYFRVERDGSAAAISWKTSSEEKALHFEVQRAVGTNGHFVTIGTVDARNATHGGAYTFRDESPGGGKNYYRLKSVDIDGAYTNSHIVFLDFAAGEVIISSLGPNPARDRATLKLEGKLQGAVSIVITDYSGARVFARRLGRQNTNLLQIDLDTKVLARGTYVIRITVDKQVFLQKMLVQ